MKIRMQCDGKVLEANEIMRFYVNGDCFHVDTHSSEFVNICMPILFDAVEIDNKEIYNGLGQIIIRPIGSGSPFVK